MTAAARILRRLVRRATKPIRKWITECQIEKSRENVQYFDSVRQYLIERERAEVVKQTQLAARLMGIERNVL